MRRITVLVLALFGLAAAVPGSGSAYVVGGYAWPGTTIHYYVAAGAGSQPTPPDPRSDPYWDGGPPRDPWDYRRRRAGIHS